VTFVSVSHCC